MSDNEEEKEAPSPEHVKKDKETEELIERASGLLARKLVNDLFGTVDNSESISNAGKAVDESSELKKKRKVKLESDSRVF